MRAKDFDELLGVAKMPKWLTDSLAQEAKLAASLEASLGPMRHLLEAESRMASKLAKEARSALIASGMDSHIEAMMALAREQERHFDSLRASVPMSEIAERLESFSKLLPDLKALDWSLRDSPLLRQLADQARLESEFFDKLGLSSPETASRSELFRFDGPLPVPTPRKAEPEAALAEFVEAQGEAQLTLGKLSLKQAMWAEAEAHFRRAAKWLRGSAEPHIGLGFALNFQGKHEAAVKAFERAERRDPECFMRADVRASYEASLQGRRWDGQLDDDPPQEN